MRKIITTIMLLACWLVACKKEDNRPECERENWGWLKVVSTTNQDTFALYLDYGGKHFGGDTLFPYDSLVYRVPEGVENLLTQVGISFPWNQGSTNVIITKCKERRVTCQ